MYADAVRVVLRAAQQTVLAQPLQHLLARGEAIEPFEVFSGGGGHLSGFVDHLHLRQLVAQPRFVVALVVRRCHFHDAGAELAIDEDRIGDDRNASIRNRNDGFFGEIAMALVIGCTASAVSPSIVWPRGLRR